MLTVADDGPANPTGTHRDAQRMRAHLEAARESLAALLSVAPERVVFTSGGTESDNTAIAACSVRGCLIYSAVEHPAVALPAARAAGKKIPALYEGGLDTSALFFLMPLEGPIGAVSVMAANNETGVVHDIGRIGRAVETSAPDAWFHTDAVQAFTKVPLDVGARWLVSISAHKIGGPVGIGALVLGDEVEIEPFLRGGGQERGMRGGTPDAAGAAAFAAAATASAAEDWTRIKGLRDRLEKLLCRDVDGLFIHAGTVPRLPTHSFVGVRGIDSDMLVIACDRAGLSASSGSSCASGAHKGSGVLEAMGVPTDGALRLTLGWNTTEADVDFAAEVVAEAVERLSG